MSCRKTTEIYTHITMKDLGVVHKIAESGKEDG
jgi:hypothetical protein